LQVGYSGLLGLGLPALLGKKAMAAGSKAPGAIKSGKAKSVILVWLTGGPSHLETFDVKPDAPAGIRGDFKAIATKLPGIHFSEHVARLAARNDKFALVRSLAHKENNHLVATHHLLTGHQQPGAFFDKIASRDDWPNYSSTLDYLKPRRDGVPSGVNLPTFLMEGPLIWPGQYAGFLGAKHDPWQLTSDPNAANFRVDGLHLARGIEVSRLRDRRALLNQVNRRQKQLGHLAENKKLSDHQRLAFSVLASGKVAKGFEIDREPASVRDRYGRHPFGQSLLLARRLVEAGVSVVQANMGKVQNWDSHGDIFRRLKQELLPPLDQGVAALLDDLEARGLLQDTLVVLMGEFGRTPKVINGGRDHWAQCFFGLFAGADVRPGQVIGKSDKIGAYPITQPYSPDDVGATIYHALGVDFASEIVDRLGRPVQLNRGRVMEALYTGA
jgi:hypothetical protein